MIEVQIKEGGATTTVLINPQYIVKIANERYLTIAGTGMVEIYQLADWEEYERLKSILVNS